MAHAEMPSNRPASGFGQRRVRPARSAAAARPAPRQAPQAAPQRAAGPAPEKARRRPARKRPNRLHTAIVQGMVAGALLLCWLHVLSHFI